MHKMKYSAMQTRFNIRQRQLRARITKAEKLVKDTFDRVGLYYKFQKGFLCKGKAVRLVDFYLPMDAICLEIDGDSHKGKEAQDAFRESQVLLSVKHASFLRITNDEIFANEVGLWGFLMDRIRQHKLSRRGRTAGAA